MIGLPLPITQECIHCIHCSLFYCSESDFIIACAILVNTEHYGKYLILEQHLQLFQHVSI